MTESSTDNKLDPRVLDRIKKILKEKGMKPVHLARGLEHSDAWSSLLMSGDRGLTVNQLIKIAEILDIHPSALLPDIGKKPEFSLAEYIRLVFKEELSQLNKNRDQE